MCTLCGFIASPERTGAFAEADEYVVEDGAQRRRIWLCRDRTSCARRGLDAEIVRWLEGIAFDNDQDPTLDTPAQRVARAFGRYLALARDLDAARMLGSSDACEVCRAVGNGNATCWSCVSRWWWMKPEERRKLLSTLIQREPGRPVDAREVASFVQRLRDAEIGGGLLGRGATGGHDDRVVR